MLLNPTLNLIRPPQSLYNILQTLNIKIYQWLPRTSPYCPNPLFLSHLTRQYSSVAWHSDFRVQYPHSLQYKMMQAITKNDLNEVRNILKDRKFRIDQQIDKKYGYNAIQFATIVNQFTVLELLLMYGANINKQDKYGNTPLMMAVDKHNLEAINSLMKNGCDRYLKNHYQIDPIQKAKSKPNQQYLVQFLSGYPKTQRKFPKLKVKLSFQEKLKNPLWNYLKKYKIYQHAPKLYPFNNFKGSYRIDLTPYQTIESLIKNKK